MDSQRLWNAALEAWETKDFQKCEMQLKQLLDISPDFSDANHLYGIVLVENGEYSSAVVHLRKTCEKQPNNDQAWSNYGNACRLFGDFEAAECGLRRGLEIAPDNPLIHFNCGLVQLARQNLSGAEVCFVRASELDPEDESTWIQLGNIRYRIGRNSSAADAFIAAAQLSGNEMRYALRMAGFALTDAGRIQEAEHIFMQLLPSDISEATDLGVLSQLLYCKMERCDWRQIEIMRERCRFLAHEKEIVEPFIFQLIAGIDGTEFLNITTRFAQTILSGHAGTLPLATSCSGIHSRRIVLGYLSGDFHDHAVMRLLIGVLECHDRTKFEIHAFSYGPHDNSQMRNRIQGACDYFHDISEFSIGDMALRIAENNIDILIDITGWTGNTRSAVLAFRPATIQINWLGWSGTIGSQRLADYVIGDPVATPYAHRKHFAESLLLLPDCCQPNDNKREVGNTPSRSEEGLPAEGLVFCFFGRPLKISPEIFSCWCNLLREIPGSVLWLYAPNEIIKKNLRHEAKVRGIGRERIVFAESKSPSIHLGRLRLADLALDTFPFGAHTTVSDALWAGVPVVTCLGEPLYSRISASLLHAVGLQELVTSNLESYYSVVLDLARSHDRRSFLRNHLNEGRLRFPLFDTEKFCKNYEEVLRNVWGDHLKT